MKLVRLGRFIRSLRIKKGLTQQSLADMLHVTDKAVSKWERGLSLPDICLLPNLADALQVSISDLLLECSDKETPLRLVEIYERNADVRTPLHIILGCVGLVKKFRDNDELFNRYLESITISGKYLLSVFEKVQNTGELENLLKQGGSSPCIFTNSYDFTGKRFLVVDDIDINREIVAELLRDAGGLVEFAWDGRMSVEKIMSSSANHYDVVLMDIKMPIMDGLEATKKLRKMGYKMPIVAMTANVSEQDKKAALDSGMDAFIEKPIFTENLFLTISNVIDNSDIPFCRC